MWKNAPTDELRAYLSTLHHGIITEENKADFTNVDITNPAFIRIQRSVRMACAHTRNCKQIQGNYSAYRKTACCTLATRSFSI